MAPNKLGPKIFENLTISLCKVVQAYHIRWSVTSNAVYYLTPSVMLLHLWGIHSSPFG